MSSDYLSKVGSSLVKKCETRDPFQIADELGVEVLFCEDFGRLKGMYRVIKRNRFIRLNKDMSDRMMRIVCAHELGMTQLHRNLAKGSAIREFMLYDMTTKPEYEANIVAAEILLDNAEMLDLHIHLPLLFRTDSETDAHRHYLVALKIAHLAEMGYDLIPIEHRQ
jgi:Zn-dependent peptidase ImmA (M78 family)